MAKYLWGLLCKEAPVGDDDNVIHIHHVIEQLNVAQTEMESKTEKVWHAPLPCVFASCLMRENPGVPETTYVKTGVRTPDEEVFYSDLLIANMEEHMRFRVKIKLGSFPITEFGFYELFLEESSSDEENAEWVKKGSALIEVRPK